MDNVKDYVELVKAPWGRMFYDLLFMQLNVPQTPKLNILDFGSGLGVTAKYFAEWHCVTAVEPNAEMIENSRKDHLYMQIHGALKNYRLLTATLSMLFYAIMYLNISKNMNRMGTEQEIMGLILGIAKADERIRAVYMNGSRALQTPDCLRV